ncbi:MAG: amino acid ABC transporter permease [Actinomycetota bacterium]
MSAVMLGDALGPRGKRRVAWLSALAGAAIVWALWVAFGRLAEAGQFEREKWELFTRPEVIQFYFNGLVNTLEVAGLGLALSALSGGVLALGRISRSPVLRGLARGYTELFRGFPLILLIFFTFYALPELGFQPTRYWSLVIALSLYNGAVMGEIFRAGILSLDRGQREAAQSIGLTHWPVMRLVILPQALRRMTPTIVSQSVTLLKDTSLGFVVSYEELLRVGQIAGEFGRNQLQSLTLVAVFYLVVNFFLSRVARHLELRQRRRFRTGGIRVAGPEDLVVVDEPAAGNKR